MGTPIRLLLVEDNPLDAQLLINELSNADFDMMYSRVETEEEYLKHLESSLDLILADYSLPTFDAPTALRLLQKSNLDIPFIVVTGTMGEETVAEVMKLGAADYLLKDRLARLGPAILQAIEQKKLRDERILIRKQGEDALRETNRRLQEAIEELQKTQQQIIQQERLRALGTMASGIAHDFNNALLPILTFSEILLEQSDNHEKLQKGLKIINTSAKDASKIVSRLREFYRHREQSEVFQPVDLLQLIPQVISMTEPRWKDQAQANGVSIQFETQLGQFPPILGKESELREMLTNLIFNAVDAMPRGGAISIRTLQQEDRIILTFSDSGVGMSEEILKRCMEPFFTTKGEHGTGLGLSMVAGIVKRHDGRINIRSHVNEGTTFTLTFPMKRGQTVGQPAVPSGVRSVPLNILVVDDEPWVREALKESLLADGHQVELARDGREGLEQFQLGRFDLVITDRAMPGLNGDKLAAIIKQSFPEQPILMLSGFGEMMNAAEECPAGVDLVLSKPVSLQDLRGAISGLVKKNQ